MAQHSKESMFLPGGMRLLGMGEIAARRDNFRWRFRFLEVHGLDRSLAHELAAATTEPAGAHDSAPVSPARHACPKPFLFRLISRPKPREQLISYNL